MIENFKKEYGIENYNNIEKDVVGKRICLKLNGKQTELKGYISYLWLPADTEKQRPNNLWYADWDDGSNGILDEKKDIIFI